MKKLRIEKAEKLLVSILLKKGLTRVKAKIVADDFIEGELSGHVSHGLMAFSSILKKGQINQAPVVKKQGPAFAYIDGRKALGQIVAHEARKVLVHKAKSQGIASVACFNSRSFLRPGYQAWKIAEKDLLGLVMINGGKSRVTPTGSIEAIFGTNPIGYAIPTRTEPIMADFATAKRAMGEVRLAELLGDKLPPDTYRDLKGEFTQDPGQVATITPFGDYKGYILSLLIEIMTGSLVNMPMGKKDGKLRGFVLLAIDPEKFGGYKSFIGANSKLLSDIKKLKKEKGVKEIIVPGDNSWNNRKNILNKGYFEISDELYSKMVNLK